MVPGGVVHEADWQYALSGYPSQSLALYADPAVNLRGVEPGHGSAPTDGGHRSGCWG